MEERLSTGLDEFQQPQMSPNLDSEIRELHGLRVESDSRCNFSAE